MKTAHIFYSKFKKELPKYLYQDYLSKLPFELQEKNQRFVRWQDRHANLFGKLLLLEALNKNGDDTFSLSDLKYNSYKRPYFEEGFDFNISHAGEYVICAFSKDVNLGVDIEKISDINFDHFNKIMTPNQWNDIHASTNPTTTFFDYWTMKESVIKADGRGLSIPLLQIQEKDREVCYENKQWYIQHIEINEAYSTCLATNVSDVQISKCYVDFYENKFNII